LALREVDVGVPGFGRRRCGRGFVYLDREGTRITDVDVVARIRGLAIPPAWTDVWICPDPRGHIQAVGVDARGRRQYRYHDEWRVARDRDKHDRMLELASALPRLRRRLRRDLTSEGMGADRVLAAAVRLLQLGLFRVGGESYAADNQSYGLATLHKRHVRIQGDELRFDYPAKSGHRRVVVVRDPDVVDVVRTLKRRRGGEELLAYKDKAGRWVDVRTSDINGYLQDVLGSEFSAKDFRTWTATVLAAVALAAADDAETDRQRHKAVVGVVRDIAHVLGNTPSVARTAYVDPRVIERYHDGQTVGDTLPARHLDAVAGEVNGSGVAASPGGDAGDDVGGASGGADAQGDDDDITALDGIPERLLAEIDAAVVDLIDGSARTS
jgi:DNA topoisomerase-1